MSKQVLPIIMLSLGLSACSAPGVKPQDANLLEAAVNISSGEFDSQLSRENFKLKSSQDALNREADKNQSLNKQLESLTLQGKALDKQLAILQSENTHLMQQADKTKATTSIQQVQRERQAYKIKKLNTSIVKLKRKKTSAKGNEQYEAKVKSLQKEIDVLRKMISNQ